MTEAIALVICLGNCCGLTVWLCAKYRRSNWIHAESLCNPANRPAYQPQ